METVKVAVVTGANKGIGYAIVKGLCEKFDGKVYLTARDENRGTNAVKSLKELGLNPVFHQLDINDQESVNKFRDHIKATDGGIDLLVNNAAVAYKNDATEPFSEQAEVTVKVNYFSTLRVCETLLPLLRSHARVVNVSSSAGHLSRIPSQELRSKFSNPALTVSGLNELMNQFVEDAKNGENAQKGWGNSAYVVSKVGVSALTVIQQRNFDSEPEKRDISVNSVHPGYVNTDMTSHKGPLTIEEGARAPLYLALEPHGLRGQYIWFNSTVVDWYAPSTPTAV
ncbi:hypothetical protein ILUMI_10080 [Ignelater luminosus]|uniref:carbonyl reductase (NADPH) n=1 Tax=Ignelater luminosus TaxID=2038154 RepID=A0A8K0D2Q6_IGNLU|nr:hypothetical protein ILUMI_10080 [Ignelater luminosus]